MRKLLAEVVGTYALVFAGTGAIIINSQTQAITHPGIAMVFGLVVMALIYAFGELSGAHFNPAVTIGFWIARQFPGKSVAPYLISQVIGALFASLTLRGLFGNVDRLGATIPAGTDLQSLVLEILLTAFLMLVILRVATGSKEQGIMAGIAIGGVIALEAMFAGPISGASMNPARSIAPAIISGNIQSLWVYLVGPIFGAGCAVLIWKLLRE